MSLLSVKNLSVVFDTRDGEVSAVNNVSFDIEQGKILGIVGESGSGKSVACYSLLGLVPTPPGRIASGSAIFDGVDLLQLNPSQLRAMRGNRIGMIFQDPMTSLNPHMTIAKQLMEPLLVHRHCDRKTARERAIAALEEVGINDAKARVDSYPHEFSGGMRQRVMIAMALINRPEILIADEPTTALDVTVQAQILALIKTIQTQQKLTVIFISHDLGVIAKIADTVAVMEKGQVVEFGCAEDVLNSPRHDYTKKLIAAIPKTAKSFPVQFSDSDPYYLDVRGLSKTYPSRAGWFGRSKLQGVAAVAQVDLNLRRGEILGLVGESGSGKSTLGKSIMRLIAADEGQVYLGGRELVGMNREELRVARRDFQMIFQDPYASLNPRMTVFDTLLEPLKTHRILPTDQCVQRINELMDDVGLARAMIRKYPHEFSGGQRQRIAIARALAMNPKLIVADEPVSALDVTVQAQILKLLLQLTEKYKLAMLFISHDLSVVRYIADRVIVMNAGRIVEEGVTEQIFMRPAHSYTQALLSAIPLLDMSSKAGASA